MRFHLPICLLSAVLACYVGGSVGFGETVYDDKNKTYVYDIYGNGELTINGGTFKRDVYGGGFYSTVTGGTQVTIIDGSFEDNNSAIYGGGFYSTVNDGTQVEISGGDFNNSVYGGGYGGSITGGTHVTISGGIFTDCSLISAGNLDGGSISGGTTVTIKNGALNGYIGSLEGGVVSDKSLRSLIISGGSNDLSGATLSNFDKIQVTDQGELVLSTIANSVTELDVGEGSTLAISGENSDSFTGILSGEGTVAIQGGKASFDMAGNIDVSLEVDKGTLVLGNTAASYKGISVQNGGALTVGTVASDGGSALRASRAASGSSTQLTLGGDGLTVGDGSTLTLTLNASSVDELVSGSPVVTSEGDISLADGSTLVLNNAGSITSAGDEEITVTLMTSTGGTASVGAVTLTDNVLKALYDTEVKASDDNKSVVLVGTQVKDNVFTTDDDNTDSADSTTSSASSLPANAGAGAELLWNDRFDALASGSPLADVFTAAVDQQAAGDTATLSKTLAAVAGSTVNSAGTAQRDALRDQLGTIRDRALAVSTDGSQLGHHFWIEGNGGYNHVRTQSDKGGYKLSTWGGTVGADLEATKDLTLGLAFTANYGDLRATAADRTTGDLDSYYLNLFAHYQKNVWGHTLVLTGTTTDADLDRTVDYGAGYYKTNGSTDGYGIGALYELTYDVKLNDKGTSLLQPLFDASIVHTSLDNYTESGAGDAGLKVGKQDWTTASLAVGARWSGTFGTKTVGRTLFGELRTAVSQDFGDKQGKTAVALSGAPDFSQNVYGAKQGSTAWQVSGGISTNVGQNGTVYASAGAEFRNDANSVRGNVGYRFKF